VRFRFITELKI